MKKHLLLLLPLFLLLHAGSQSISMNLNYQNTVRNFLVHLPTGYTAGQQLPLVINMHGYTSNAQQQEAYSLMDITANNNQFIVCYPNGLNNSWNSGFTLPYNSSPDDVGFISKVIDTLHALYDVNLNRVYACGMSNGGFQSHRLACDLENRIAAIASVTGTIAEVAALNCTLSRHVPVMQVHGTLDPVVNYNGGTGSKSVEETINFWLGKDGCQVISDTFAFANTSTTDGSTVERIRYRDCDGQTEIWFYKVTGGGHTWPGGAIDIPTNGNTNRDINASQEIWDFFNRYTLSGPTGLLNIAGTELQLTVFPNPTTGTLQVTTAGIDFNESLALTVTDVAGKSLLTQNLSAGANTVDISKLAKGIYIVQVRGKAVSATRRIIKD